MKKKGWDEFKNAIEFNWYQVVLNKSKNIREAKGRNELKEKEKYESWLCK